MSDLLQIVPSVIGGGFLGSLATHYLTSGRERREIRSTVLAKLSDVEQMRWAHTHTRVQFRDALRDLETAALIARLPRDLVLLYKFLAESARDLSDQDIEDDPTQDDETAGSINGEFANVIRDTAAAMSRAIWAPVATRIRQRANITTLENKALAVERSNVRMILKQNSEFYDYRWHTKKATELPRPR